MRRREAIASAVLVGFAAAVPLAVAWHWVTLLLATVRPYVWWLAASVGTAAFAGFSVTACILAAPTRRRLGVVLISRLATRCPCSWSRGSPDCARRGSTTGRLPFLRARAWPSAFFCDGADTAELSGPILASRRSTRSTCPIRRSGRTTSPPRWTPQRRRFFFCSLEHIRHRPPTLRSSCEHLPAYRRAGRPLCCRLRRRHLAVALASARRSHSDWFTTMRSCGSSRSETAAPYFEAEGGACRVAPESRERVVTECERPARLIRRELFFDGWRATVNGQPRGHQPGGDRASDRRCPRARPRSRSATRRPMRLSAPGWACWVLLLSSLDWPGRRGLGY